MNGRAKCIFKRQSLLGEGPLWDEGSGRLLFVDIMGKKINIFNPVSGECDTIETEKPVGCIVLDREGNIISAEQNMLVKIRRDTNERTRLFNFGIDEFLRFNDGKCDAAGRLWVGTMAIDRTHPRADSCGSFFSADSEGNICEHFTGMAIPNGIAFSADGKFLYHIDTPTHCISRYAFDVSSGALSNKKTVVRVPESEGSPDGMTIDREGMLWVALWGGYAVARYNPETGEQLFKIEVGAENTSCCAFGGRNMDELFITTAMNDKGEGGELYWYKTDTKGFAAYKFGG